MKWVLICIAALLAAAHRPALANSVILVERTPYKHVLEGLVDYDSYSAVPLPGTWYRNRLPSEGVIAHTYFSGQIPSLGAVGIKRNGANAGAPNAPLQEGQGKRSFSELHLYKPADEPDNVRLTSHSPDIASFGLRKFQGHGALVLKFTNAQFVFGFDLFPLKENESGAPNVQLRFYDYDGKIIGAPVLLTAFGRHTFRTSDSERRVKGFDVTNLGTRPYAIDDIVFELVKFLG